MVEGHVGRHLAVLANPWPNLAASQGTFGCRTARQSGNPGSAQTPRGLNIPRQKSKYHEQAIELTKLDIKVKIHIFTSRI